MSIVRTTEEIRVSCSLREDLWRRAHESGSLLVCGLALLIGAHLLGFDFARFRPHLIFAAAVPWILQLIQLPNSLGASPLPSYTVRITAEFVALERYGIEMRRIRRPVTLTRRA